VGADCGTSAPALQRQSVGACAGFKGWRADEGTAAAGAFPARLSHNAVMAQEASLLTPAQRRSLADRLAERQRELRTEIADQLRTQDDPRLVGLRNRLEETDDWAVADMMAEQDIALVSRDLTELAEVEAALARMADGIYGECNECSQPIPAARLTAYPTARRCVACQEAAEAHARRTGA
jgi:DnaK suppressor protein